jgi:predicted metal-dependent peptidase
MAITMTTARPDQLPAILALLARSELPPDGLGDHLATTLLACDAAVAAPPVRVSSLAEAKGSLRGGGGTRFDPIFAEAAKMSPLPDAVIVITDSYGSVSQTDPRIPTVWALVGGADKAPAPWGRAVVVRDDK